MFYLTPNSIGNLFSLSGGIDAEGFTIQGNRATLV